MKVRAYMRIARSTRGYKVSGGNRPSLKPLTSQEGYGNESFLPTVSFAIDFEIPDELFDQQKRVIGEINVATKDVSITAPMLKPLIEKLEAKLRLKNLEE